MAYNDDSVLARLSALNESHDSIATAAQWIMFHRRHADRTVQLWLQRLKDSSSTKRLSLIYMANEVAQQSKIRHKDDFIIAFAPVIAESIAIAYKGASSDIQAKLRRVVDVWKDRSIFEGQIQEAIQARINDLEKVRGTIKSGFGSSPFGSSVPSELSSIVTTFNNVSKLSNPAKSTLASAKQEYDKQMDPGTDVASAPVYAARLNGLLKTLASAEGSVSELIKAREDLIGGLDVLLQAHKLALEQEQDEAADLLTRKRKIEDTKQQVEAGIMRALGPADNNGSIIDGEPSTPPTELDRPEVEALTPPPMEVELDPVEPLEPHSAEIPEVHEQSAAAPEAEAVSTTPASYQALPISTNGSNKRRRVDDSGDFPDLGGDDDIDAEVVEMLKGAES